MIVSTFKAEIIIEAVKLNELSNIDSFSWDGCSYWSINYNILLECFDLFKSCSKCLGKHSCMSSTLPIAILNGTFFLVDELPVEN